MTTSKKKPLLVVDKNSDFQHKGGNMERSCCEGQGQIARARDAAQEKRMTETKTKEGDAHESDTTNIPGLVTVAPRGSTPAAATTQPSPEAKQAAEAKGYRQDKGYEYGAFVEGYDTATAKAREEYEEVLTDHKRLVRELDVALNGNGAAKQASLCDIVAQVTTNEQAYRDGTLSQPSASELQIESQVPELLRAVDENLRRAINAEQESARLYASLHATRGELNDSLRYIYRLETQLGIQQPSAPTAELDSPTADVEISRAKGGVVSK